MVSTADPDNTLERDVGDDWVFGPIALTLGGKPLDLTGSRVSAQFFVRAKPGCSTFVEGANLTVDEDRTLGRIVEVWVPRENTKVVPPEPRGVPCSGETRVNIVVTDSLGRQRTWLSIYFRPIARNGDARRAGC